MKVNRHAGIPDPGPSPKDTDSEAALDIQYLAGVGLSNSNWIFNTEHWVFELVRVPPNPPLTHTYIHPLGGREGGSRALVMVLLLFNVC